MMLSQPDFLQVIKNAPLIAVDFILEDSKGRYLLGLRNNEPAKGFYFVPGGRIRKDEKFDDAFKRISLKEFGQEMQHSNAEFIGIFEHLYPECNFFNEPNVSTHYIVLGFKVKIQNASELKSDPQHAQFRWLTKEELLKDPEVHKNAKTYFDPLTSDVTIASL